MARTLIARLNIGMDDKKQYGIPESDQGNDPPLEGDTISLSDEQEPLANILVNKLQCCVDYDPAAEERHAREVEEQDNRVMEQRVASQVAVQQAEEAARERMQARAAQPRGAQRSMQGPSQPAKVQSSSKPENKDQGT